MNERRGWAEALVVVGGLTLAVTFFLPLVRDWGPPGMDWFSTIYIVHHRLGEIAHAAGPVDVLRRLLLISFLFAPHAFGTLVCWEAIAAPLGPGGPSRLFRVGVRCCLFLWLAGSLLLPMISKSDRGPSYRTMCVIFVGLLVVVWAVVGRWWPARSHAAFMRRSRLMGSVLIATWFGFTPAAAREFYLTGVDAFFPGTIALSASGAMLIALGSLPGLRARPEPE